MKDPKLCKSSKRKSGSNKDWGTKPPTSNDHTPPKWESPIKPKDLPVNLSQLEQIEFNGTTFYVLYSRKAVPPLSDAEFEALCTDVAEKEVIVDIIVDEHYIIIDGEHRLRAAIKARLKQVPIQVRPGLTESEKWKMAQDLNLKRRHLTPQQIQQIIKENRGKLPQMALKLRQDGNSLRQIGEQLGVSHTQVQKLINKESAVNEITPETPKRVKGKDGKKYPAKKPVINVNTTKELQRAIDACHTVGADNLPAKPLELKRVERMARETKNEKLRQQEVQDYTVGQIQLLQGDFNVKGQDIPDNSVDLIFTDPPYDQASLPLWSQLGKLASRVLKPSGLLVTYSGCLYLNQIYAMLDKHLTYLWTAAIYHTGAKKKIYPVGMNQAWKPILIYFKEPKDIYWPTITDMVSGGEEKADHPWQQSVYEALHYIKAFCPRNGTLLDPMMGSGTSLIAGLQSGLGLKCIGIELDKATYIETEEKIRENAGENSAA